MSDYTLYCNTIQTRKAIELGAPIESEFEYQFLSNQEHGYYIGDTFQGLVECMGENIAIFGNEPNRAACIIPTSEQMIGWLEEQEEISDLHIYKMIQSWTFELYASNGAGKSKHSLFQSRKEATLAAIDAALEYLNKNRK